MRNSDGYSAFLLACLEGHATTAVYLYESGADVSIPDKGTTPSLSDKWLEASAKMHHILGDYYLAIDAYDKARASYVSAQDYYKRIVESGKKDLANISNQQFAWSVLSIVGAALEPYGERSRARQSAQISALKYADQSGTGIRGYQAYMSK